MKTIYFVRHGESKSNASNVLLGLDASLTERGVKQAKAVGTRFTRIDIDIVITSLYSRAQKTAQAIATATHKPLVECEHIHERINPSFFIGRHREDSERQSVEQEQLEAWANGNTAHKHTDEETYEDLFTRAKLTKQFLEERPEKHIVVVTHGTFLRFFFVYILYGDKLTPELFVPVLASFVTSNTGITVYEVRDETRHQWDNTWKLITWMDKAHLG